MKTEKEQRRAAAVFAARWAGKGNEKSESQPFWIDLLGRVFGIEELTEFVEFEDKVKLDNTAFIDVMIPSTHVLIEQKSLVQDLRKPIRQSDGAMLTPIQQALRYSAALPYSQRPRWIVTCNFAEFLIYDMEQPRAEPQSVLLKNLATDYYRLQFLVDAGSESIRKEMEVSIKAGELVGKIYDALLPLYLAASKRPALADTGQPTASSASPQSANAAAASQYANEQAANIAAAQAASAATEASSAAPQSESRLLRWLNILCVRLVFCLYAEDAGVFGRHNMFYDYLKDFRTACLRNALLELFDALNTPPERRSPFIWPELAAFPYTNGGLFAERIDVPQFNDGLRGALLLHASREFDWSQISPTIFGSVFESTLNPETRRAGGMHYTSIENIHRVIDPLFLNSLRAQLVAALAEPVAKTRLRRLRAFQDKLASLRFLDPACGSGNFLTETYLSLRRLENRAIREMYSIEPLDAFTNPIRVSIHQFYGIEVNDFAVTVATTALWISESQMMAETEAIIHHDIDFLPLRSYANIHEGNALCLDWESVMPKQPELPPTQAARQGCALTYIIGNPPFVGARMMSREQKADMLAVFGPEWRNLGNIDYVGAWYKRAADYMRGTTIEAALVSTNSISQGEQVANLWAPLMQQGLRINFARRTFRWDSEASLKAHVHVVIVGFAYTERREKFIFDGGQQTPAAHINPYLVGAPDVFLYSRSAPLCQVPPMGIGNKPIDGGNYLFTAAERDAFIAREPQAAALFHPWLGAEEFIHRRPRYCLWLGDCTPAQINAMPLCKQRVENVRQLRLQSKSAGTRKLAERPTRFHVENMPDGDSVIIPRVSSERRRYIPMGYIEKGVLASDAVHLIPNATLYHFGVLQSNVHMAWMRTVCGRLKSDYRYSKDIVYNNFPWPKATAEQRESVAATAQGILNARAKYPDSSLADLYDPTAMPYDLLQAHRQNDRAVLAAYGFPAKMTEPECVARLLKLYRRLAG